MDPQVIKQRLRMQRLDALLNDCDPHYTSLVETAELLISLDEWVVKNYEIKTWRGWFLRTWVDTIIITCYSNIQYVD